jgi:hypothetical protein
LTLPAPYDAALDTVLRTCEGTCGHDGAETIRRAFGDILDLFAGRWPGFQPCDTPYHDVEHTMQTVVPMAQIMAGWNASSGQPAISRRFFELGIIAILCHDTGYIKRRGDRSGTGGKYTFRHVRRSIDFAKAYLPTLGYGKEAAASARNIIGCTEVNISPASIRFASREEQLVGFSVGTADLIGQLSAQNYLQKLPRLFEEFSEGYRYEGAERLAAQGVKPFESPEQLLRSYPQFYENFVKKRLAELGSMHRLLPEGYLKTIEGNIRRLQRRQAKSRAAN